MPSTSLRSAATLGSTCHSSGLAASILSLPALVLLSLIRSLLITQPLRWRPSWGGPDRSATSRCSPCTRLVEPAAVAPVPLRVGRGASKTPIVLEAVWNSGVTVAVDETRNEGGAPPRVLHRADVEAGQVLVAGCVIEHGHFSLLLDDVQSQIDGLKRAEVHQGNLLVGITVQCPLGTCGTQGTLEEGLRTHIVHQAAASQNQS